MLFFFCCCYSPTELVRFKESSVESITKHKFPFEKLTKALNYALNNWNKWSFPQIFTSNNELQLFEEDRIYIDTTKSVQWHFLHGKMHGPQQITSKF